MDGTKALIDKQIQDAKQAFLENEALQCKTYLDNSSAGFGAPAGATEQWSNGAEQHF